MHAFFYEVLAQKIEYNNIEKHRHLYSTKNRQAKEVVEKLTDYTFGKLHCEDNK